MAQIRPSLVADVNDLSKDFARRKMRLGLRQKQRHCCRGARNSHVTMHEKMPDIFRIAKNVAPEIQNLGDVARLGRLKAGSFLDNIMKFQVQSGVLAIGAKNLRLRQIGIDDRKHVADFPASVTGEFVQPANSDHEWGVDNRHSEILGLRRVSKRFVLEPHGNPENLRSFCGDG